MHEHPATATWWKLPEVQQLSREPGVECIVNDACMFGMTAKGKDGEAGPALKPTRWMTNEPYLARHLKQEMPRHAFGARSAAERQGRLGSSIPTGTRFTRAFRGPG